MEFIHELHIPTTLVISSWPLLVTYAWERMT